MSEASATDYELAVEGVVGFAQEFDRTHLDLACHAAFPLVLTPDLLYQIWLRFVPQAPWTAVARVLLSRLCREVGYELYEMDVAVRNLLLTELKEDERFGQKQLEKLAGFLTNYVRRQFDGQDSNARDLAQAQYWTALAYTKPDRLSREILEAINLRLQQKNWKELFRLSSLVETFAEPLTELAPLVITYARGIERLTCGDQIIAEELFRRLPKQKRYIEIYGVNVPILERIYISTFGQGNSSLTVYAFHLRNSINQELQPTLPAASRLWEQLVDFGNALHIPELQTLRQQLICYEGDRYFPEAEDIFGAEYFTLLQNQEPSLHFQVPLQAGGLELQGLLCPFRLHDTYAIDLTLFSEDTFTLPQLTYLNPQNLILENIQPSLGQTLLLFGQPSETQEDNYQALADACVAQLLPQADITKLVGTGRLLGNPIFEYENKQPDSVQKLHILVWFKCQDMNSVHMDRVAEILLHLLWCRHKIIYVYQQFLWCVSQVKQLFNALEESRERFNNISHESNKLSQLIDLLVKFKEIEFQYFGYLNDLEEHEKTLAINEINYKTYLKKLENISFTDLDFCQYFLNEIHYEIQQQHQEYNRYLNQIKTSLINENAVIIQWQISENYFKVYIIIKKQSAYPIIWQSSAEDSSALSDWANEYSQDYQENKQHSQEQLSLRLQNLTQILHLDEILNHLPKTCDQLILIPHRFLHCIPLHALPLADGSCLLDLFPGGVRYAPSCQLLQLVQTRQRPEFSHFLAIQNPTQNIPYTDIEVETIKQYFPHADVLANAAATKDVLNNQTLHSVHCLHFSGHSDFNIDSPLESRLFFADEPVTLEEIFTLDMSQCSLVTLSASDTALTNWKSAKDEHISFPSAFLLAGSTNVVGSLWDLNDLSTALLMIKFYQNLQTGSTVAVALNQAQVWLRDITKRKLQIWIEENKLLLRPAIQISLRRRLHKLLDDEQPFREPFHWAAFCAIGQSIGVKKMALSPYEETILDFVYIAQNKPELFTAEDRADFAQLVATLPEDVEVISNAIAFWCQTRPHILDAIFALPVGESDSVRAAGGRNTPMTGKEAKEAIENTVRESIPPEKSQTSKASKEGEK
ncbi:MAG: CHAT domain-containing protein [Symploca sp. SIO1C4]|uniref:CHAT domain-containing protein n=1 Tax=Symploca sp. SIO1C4 TaxID=2607765 RepID=A0A6B3N969_9CYAN|nr:CHAT domain-containing protein [Symploca sp. SIO1C4]